MASEQEHLLAAFELALDLLAARATRALEAAGIPVILLKGWSIREWLYQGASSSRHYTDVDLLVPSASYATAGSVLGALGFSDPVARVRPTEGQANARAWRNPEGYTIDLHRTLIGVGVDDETLWGTLLATSTASVVGGQTVRVLGPGARALHVAMHAAQHGLAASRPLEDLQRCLRQVDSEEWALTAEVANRLGAVDALAAGLRLVANGGALADRLGLPDVVPVEVALRAQSAPELALGFARLAKRRSWKGRAGYLLSKVFPSAEFLRDWSPVARRGRLGLVAGGLLRVGWLAAHAPKSYLAWRTATRTTQIATTYHNRQIRVLRLYHSGVVSEWRERDRQLRHQDVDVTLVTARRWLEGTATVEFSADGDDFAKSLRTYGSHVNAFVFAPIKLWRIIRDGHFDVIDIHEEPCSLATAEVLMMRAILARRTRVVIYTAENIVKRYPAPFRWIERVALRVASGVYACAADSATVIRTKSRRPLVSVVPLGVDRRSFVSQKRSARNGTGQASSTSFEVGFVGRIEERKGVFVALDAVADEPSWRLRLVGDGIDRTRLEREVQLRGLSERVLLEGSLRHEALPAFYSGIDVLVVPSLETPTWKEQFGRVVIEAMSAGCPVVVSDTGALPLVVNDERLVVPAGDARALHQSLSRLASDIDLRERLGTEGRARSEQWEWANVAALHRNVYMAALGVGSTSPTAGSPAG